MALLLVAAGLVGCGSNSRRQPEPLDVLIVAGQSNAVGFDARASELPADPLDKEALLWWRVGDPPPDDHDSRGTGWMPLRPQPKGKPLAKDSGPRQYGNFRFPDGGFGPEIGVARALRSADVPLAVLKVAFSGTSLARDWDPDGEGDAGACYRALRQEAEAALQAARDQGFEPRLRAFFWIQGESDANAEGAALYGSRCAKLLASLRDEFSSPGLAAVLAVNTRFGGGKNPQLAKVVAAQRLVAEEDPYATYVDTSAASVANGAHFDAPGTLAVGRLMGEALLQLEGRISR